MDLNSEMLENDDHQAATRKQDHIELAFRSATSAALNDSRFNYEPMLSEHKSQLESITIFEKEFKLPFWVSSMTGGTEKAGNINRILATVAGKYGFGMGLGSCRALLYSDEHLADFNVRKYLGNNSLLYANLGIAQVQQLIDEKKLHLIAQLLQQLEADGLIVHVNPLQEWLQPEGDRFTIAPIHTIKTLLDQADYKIIVKEVGQGIGPESLKTLLQLPLEGIEFAAFGGTNFAKLELLRTDEDTMEHSMSLSRVGHTADDMVEIINSLGSMLGDRMLCKQFIISGGIQNFLDIHYLRMKLRYLSIAGQASAMLKYAQIGQDALEQYIETQIKGLLFGQSFLTLKTDNPLNSDSF
ncbi:MAG: isopentenyl-diphosphate delta-isomerase [Bacteroidetes bacterium]|nr:isopentenyl-diphosphate delta-isomerase [Bacteroidota bacterium]